MSSILGLFLLVMVLAGCGVGPTDTTNPATTTTAPEATTSTVPADDHQQLEEARRRWADAGIDTYTYAFEDDCGECMAEGEVTVIVWEGLPSTHDAMTVDQVLDAVATALDGGTPVEVTYDPDLGHPVEVWLDREARAYDGGTHWLIRQFEPGLPHDATTMAAFEAAHQLWETKRPAAYELETEIICDCSFDSTVSALIEGTRVVDWDVAFTDGVGAQLSPLTIDAMFDDLSELLESPDGFTEDGVRYRGFVQYDSDVGYPWWVALEIEVLDPDSEYADLPERLVTSVTRLDPVQPGGDVEADATLEAARVKWEATGLDTYTYELTIHDVGNASFSDVYVVAVENGVVTAITQDGLHVTTENATLLPVEGLFDLIKSHLAAGHLVEALYHHILGYPTFIAIQTTDGNVISVLSLAELLPTG